MLILACVMVSIGLFEANAIQFGMDQLLEASSTQLMQCIHPLHFWSTHLESLAVLSIVMFIFLRPLMQISLKEH